MNQKDGSKVTPKTRILLPIATAALLVVSGCAGGTQPTPTVTVTETVTAEPEAPAEQLPAETEEPVEPPVETKPEDTEIKFESRGESPRGNVIKHVGDWAGLQDDATGDITVAFRVSEIIANPKCTSGFSDKSKNGQLVHLQFEIITYPELKEHGDFWMSAHEFTGYLADGTRINDSVGAGSVCLSDADSVPLTIGPGEKVTGGIVLDLPAEATVVSFNPADGNGGWEWLLVEGGGA